MERSIRIGKDFNVRWSIHKVVDGERQPYELAGKELEFQYRTPYGIKKATEWTAEGNFIVWTFRGKEQKALGSYELILTENGGKDGMVTVDTCRAFKLVAHSCEETEGSGSDIVIEDVVLESEVTFAALRGPQGERGPEGPQGEQGPAGPSYDDTEIKGKLAELSAKVATLVDATRINVRDFGAIGDGVANDEDAIRAAFAYAVENLPCEVYFPKGDYGILNGGFPVKIPNGKGGLRISGDGGNLSRIVYLPDFEMTTGEGWYAIRVQPTTTPTNEDGYIHDISIVNMGVYDTDPYKHALNPDSESGSKEETHGFDIQYAIRARVEGCFIDSVGDECIDIYSCVDTIVTNNITHNSPAAGSSGGAISIGDGSHNVIVSNNIVRGNIATKDNFGIAIESLKIPVSKVVISNNTISSLSGTGVKLSTPNQGASITDVDIIGNVVNGCTYGIGDEGNYEKKNITISSNVLTDIAHTAIYLSKQGSNILIDGCVIDSCQYAMWLNPLISISNCTITNIYGYVAMVSSDEVIFDNCKIDNVCQDTTSWVIYIYGDEPIVSVRNCSITNIHSSRGLQKMKNVVNTDIYFTASGDAVSGVAITEKVAGVSTNGRISIGKNYAMVRDVSIVSENIGSNAITIAANVIGASVLGCYVNINNYSAIKENSGCDKNLICNNVTNMSVVKVGENSVVQNNIKL